MLAAALAAMLALAGLAPSMAAVAAGSPVRTPHSRLSVTCAKVLPAKTRRTVWGTAMRRDSEATDSYRPARAYSPIKGALREAGRHACSWTSVDGGVRVSALAGAAAQYRRAIARYDVPGVVRTKDSATYCLGEGDEHACDADLLVGTVWVEVHMSVVGRPRTNYHQARTVLAALRRGYAVKPRGAWRLPATAWRPPKSCSELDPQSEVAVAAGLPEARATYGNQGVDSLTGSAAIRRERALACLWETTDSAPIVEAFIAPGADWARPTGTKVKASLLGAHVQRVRWHRSRGRLVLDVIARGGWVQVVSKQDLHQSESAARVLLRLLG